jgi:molecular chaperone GrpE
MSKQPNSPADEVRADEADAANDEAIAGSVTGHGNLADELAAEKDRSLRLAAEMQNLRNRTSREIADERKYAALPVMRDLLPVLDNIGRAIEAAEKAGEAENLLAGFRLVRQQLETILSRHECVSISPEGELFDPHFHQAILQQPSPDVPAGHVMMVTQTGYKLHDRVVRPAQVIVSSGPPEGM